MIRILLWALLFCANSSAATYQFQSRWQGTDPWAGPDFWARPLFAWKKDQNAMVVEAGPGRCLFFLPWQKNDSFDQLTATVIVRLHPAANSESKLTWCGFGLGQKQKGQSDPRRVLVNSNPVLPIGINGKGHLIIGDQTSLEKLPSLDRVTLKLTVRGEKVTVTATHAEQSLSLTQALAPLRLQGHLGLMAVSPRTPPGKTPTEVSFSDFSLTATGETARIPSPSEQKARQFGPIAWSQYSLSGDHLKLSAQCLPFQGSVKLEAELSPGTMTEVQSQPIDPLSRTALFSIPDWPSDRDIPYRLSTSWQGQTYDWSGTIRAEPKKGTPLKIGVFSCDFGYMFPNTTVVNNVTHQNPDLLFFAGDQIYEGHGGFYHELIRTPDDRSMLDYLRKWYQFGWAWRDLLKNTPSIIVLDDHDVFQGNIWGDGASINTLSPKEFMAGGYTQSAAWVNAAQRAQAGHLPPHPSGTNASGIKNYYTSFQYAGIPFAILEDRKFKTGPKRPLREGERLELLGSEQEKFLQRWAAQTADAPIRLLLSQTIFAQVNTHGGAKLTPVTWKDFDTNGWPKAGRDRALRPLMNNPNTIMLCGDQHFGILLRHGIDHFDDGPYALMVPGTANWWPRAFWPKGPDAGPTSWPGPYTDPHGNKVSVLAAANPTPGTTIEIDHSNPERSAHSKGSGHGLLTIDPTSKQFTVNMFRTQFNASHPTQKDQFPGFPQTIQLQ